eukprot:scaffold277097_cov39-Prasinocladus_malaysianus.AAC.1
MVSYRECFQALQAGRVPYTDRSVIRPGENKSVCCSQCAHSARVALKGCQASQGGYLPDPNCLVI